MMQDVDMLTLVRGVEPALAKVNDRVLWNNLVMWLFRGTNYLSLHARFKKLCGGKVDTLAVTQAISSKGRIVREYKLWLFYVVKKQMPYKEAVALAKEWGVHEGDVTSFALCCQKTTMLYLRQLGRKYAALTSDKFGRICGDIVTAVRTTAKKFVYVKMRFVDRHQRTGLTLEDFENETIEQGLQKLMLQYPLIQSKLHAINIVKHIVRNHGLNMIQKFTRQKNSALVAAEGTQSRVLDISNLPVDMQPEAPSVRETSDLYLDYKHVMYKYRDKRRTLLALLSGLYHKGFSDWLSSKGIAYANDELIDRVQPKRYLKLAREWLGVSDDAVTKFLNAVRNLFAPYQARAV